MNIFSKNNIYLLSKQNFNKIIVYLPFAHYATTIEPEKLPCLETLISTHVTDYADQNLCDIVRKIEENVPQLYKTPRTVANMRSLMLLPNNKCNFQCAYCYSAKGRTNNEISLNMLKAGIGYFLNLDRAKSERLSISVLGGGEPLLSWDILKPALEYALALRDKRTAGCPISLVTNGSICTDEIISFCVDNNINLSVSFDILPDVQNKQRGHWKEVSANINRFSEAGLDVALNTVISNENVTRMSEMVNHLLSHNPLVKKISFKTLIAKDYFRDVGSRRIYYESFISNFFKAKILADTHDLWLTCSYMNTCTTLTDRYCHGKFVVTSEGDISICHTVGSKNDDLYDKFVFGHIDAQTGSVSIDENKLTEILSHDVSHNVMCEDCPARCHCAGGCYADYFHLSKEEHDVYCDSMRLFLANYLIYQYKL